MKIGLIGDYDRRISVVGHGVVPEPSENWESMGLEAFILQMIPNREENPPSSLSAHLIPVLMTGRDTLVITAPDDISKSQYLLYVLNLLGSRPRSRDNSHDGPRAVIVVPTDDRALRVAEWVAVHGTNMVEDQGLEFSIKVRAMVGANPRFYKTDDLVVSTATSLVRFLDRNHRRFKELTKFVKCLIFERTNESIVSRGEFTMMCKALFLLVPIPQPNPHPQLIIFSGDVENVCCLSEFARHLPETHFIVTASPRLVGKEGKGQGQGRQRTTTVPRAAVGDQGRVSNSAEGQNRTTRTTFPNSAEGQNRTTRTAFPNSAEGQNRTTRTTFPNSSLWGNGQLQQDPHVPDADAAVLGDGVQAQEVPEEVPLDPDRIRDQTASPSH